MEIQTPFRDYASYLAYSGPSVVPIQAIEKKVLRSTAKAMNARLLKYWTVASHHLGGDPLYSRRCGV